jgi:hypothetical protein
MATQTELKEIAGFMLQMLQDQDLDNRETLEVVLNVYGHVAQLCDVNVHDAVGAVMTYYKTNANHRQ